MSQTTLRRSIYVDILPWVFLCCFCAAAVWLIWRDPVQICGDEGMEFSKALLVARRPLDVAKAWNDQPRFYTSFIGALFRLFGFHAAIPRAFSLLCLVVFCACMRSFMPDGAAVSHHVVAIVLFVSFEGVLPLSVSAMCELPATLLALLGASVLFRESEARPAHLLMAGGALVGFATLIKLTAAIAFGAATLAFAILEARTDARSGKDRVGTRALFVYLLWLSGLLFVVLAVAVVSRPWSFELLWTTHMNAASGIPAALARAYSFHPASIFRSLSSSAFAVSAAWLLCRFHAGRWLLLVCYGLLAFAIHLVHRPFFSYYNVQFAAGFSPIAGWGIVQITAPIARLATPQERASNLQVLGLPAAARCLAFFCAWLGSDGATAIRTADALLHSRPAGEEKIVRFCRSVAPCATWAFSRSLDSSFLAHSGLLVIPELTVLSDNRYWGGYIREDSVLGIVRQYRPEVILLPRSAEASDYGWHEFLRKCYDKALSVDDRVVYIKKGLTHSASVSLGTREPSTKERLANGLGVPRRLPLSAILLASHFGRPVLCFE